MIGTEHTRLYMKTSFFALLAGITFGIWPQIMNLSRLNAYGSSLIFVTVTMLTVAPLFYVSPGNLGEVRWYCAIGASIIAAVGVVLYNSAISNSRREDIGTIIVTQVLTQVVTGAIYQSFVNGGISLTKLIGMILAIIAIFTIYKG